MSSKKKTKPKPNGKHVSVPRKPRQKDLPGMENRELRDLHSAALKYADIRDQRVALSAEEVTLKEDLISLMHKHKKTSYTFGNVAITLVVEKENIRVKVTKDGIQPENVSVSVQDEPELRN